jgi:HAMP domain-containing protein
MVSDVLFDAVERLDDYLGIDEHLNKGEYIIYPPEEVKDKIVKMRNEIKALAHELARVPDVCKIGNNS